MSIPHRDHPPLSPESIVAAALRIVDDAGLSGLSMRRLGRELGVEAMSIYHHVPNKAALLDLLVARSFEGTDDVESWDDAVELIERMCRVRRTAIRAHPNLAPLLAERLGTATRESESAAITTRALMGAGFDHEAAAWIVDAFVGFSIGQAIVELADGDAAPDDAVFETGLRFLLIGLRDELGA